MGFLDWIRGFRKRQDEDAVRRAEQRVRERPEEAESPETDLPVLDASEKAGVMYGATPEVTEDDVDEDRPTKPGE